MADLKGRDLRGIADFSRDEIELTLEVSSLLKAELKMGRPHKLLEGKSLAGIFETQSTRTSISFETAMVQLGGHMHYIDQHRLWVGEGEEDWYDTIKTIDRYVDGIAHRAVRRDLLERAAELATVPLINASCPLEHPCQAFADIMTMVEKKGPIGKSKVAMLWGYRKANPPAGLTNSMMLMAGKLGFEFVVACPEGFDPDMKIKAEADKDAALSGGGVKIVHSYDEAVKDADFISVYSWVSPEIFAKGPETNYTGGPEFVASKAKLKDAWCVTRKVVEMARKDCKVMHCMPISRNYEVTDEVLNSPKSIIFDEAENRLHTEKAILALLMGGYR